MGCEFISRESCYSRHNYRSVELRSNSGGNSAFSLKKLISSNKIADTVLLTTKCSGGCSHCPFSNPTLEKLFLTPEIIRDILQRNSGKLTILSGGEPFEHPAIDKILHMLANQNNLF